MPAKQMTTFFFAELRELLGCLRVTLERSSPQASAIHADRRGRVDRRKRAQASSDWLKARLV